MNRDRKHGLGRGLSALMADVGVAEPEGVPRPGPRAPQAVPIEDLAANPDQPRRRFDEKHMNDLIASVREKGVLQPLLVRRVEGAEAPYQIIAGERRWRAAQAAQLHELPVVVLELNDTEVLEVAIIENIQRADLNPVEEAAGFRQLMDRFGHTQEKLAEALGKSRSYIANILRLLQLPPEIQRMVSEGTLSAGHARALITAQSPYTLAQKVVSGGLSVRQTEAMVKREAAGAAPSPRPGPADAARAAQKDADTRVLEQDLSGTLGLPVVIDHQSGGEAGQVTIRYKTLEQLDILCAVLSRGQSGSIQ